MTRLIDALDHATVRAIDRFSGVSKETLPSPVPGTAAPAIRYDYDHQDNITGVIDPRGLATGYLVDGFGGQTWAWETGAIAFLHGLDDSTINSMYYPKDRIRKAKERRLPIANVRRIVLHAYLAMPRSPLRNAVGTPRAPASQESRNDPTAIPNLINLRTSKNGSGRLRRRPRARRDGGSVDDRKGSCCRCHGGANRLVYVARCLVNAAAIFSARLLLQPSR